MQLTLDSLQVQLRREEDGSQDAFQVTPSHKGGGSMGEGASRGRENIRLCSGSPRSPQRSRREL